MRECESIRQSDDVLGKERMNSLNGRCFGAGSERLSEPNQDIVAEGGALLIGHRESGMKAKPAGTVVLRYLHTAGRAQNVA